MTDEYYVGSTIKKLPYTNRWGNPSIISGTLTELCAGVVGIHDGRRTIRLAEEQIPGAQVYFDTRPRLKLNGEEK